MLFQSQNTSAIPSAIWKYNSQNIGIFDLPIEFACEWNILLSCGMGLCYLCRPLLWWLVHWVSLFGKWRFLLKSKLRSMIFIVEQIIVIIAPCENQCAKVAKPTVCLGLCPHNLYRHHHHYNNIRNEEKCQSIALEVTQYSWFFYDQFIYSWIKWNTSNWCGKKRFYLNTIAWFNEEKYQIFSFFFLKLKQKLKQYK